MSLRSPILNSRTTLAACAAIAGLMAVLPTRLTWWTRDLSAPVQIVALPVSWLVKQAALAAGGGGGGSGSQNTAANARLAQDLEALRTRNLQLAAENDDLIEQVRQLQRGITLNSNQDVARVVASVVSGEATGGSSLLMARTAGLVGADGQKVVVEAGAVAVTDGVNLVGRVIGVRNVVADIRPINDPGPNVLRGAIFPLESDASADHASVSLGTQLSGISGGRLRGSIYVLKLPDGQTEPVVTPGMVVRLSDPGWPRSAQMLVIGFVESVERADNGRPIVIVRPAFDPQRLETVTLLLTGSASSDASGGRPK